MAPFASSAWIAELGARSATIAVPTDISLVVEQRITDGPAWHFRIADGALSAYEGQADDATITLTSDHATAEAIQAGTLSAQRAFLDGALQIGGDVSVMLTHRQTLATIGELLTPAV